MRRCLEALTAASPLLPSPTSQGPWSQQETLLLLEGLEWFGEDWAAVADHVGSRSQVGAPPTTVDAKRPL